MARFSVVPEVTSRRPTGQCPYLTAHGFRHISAQDAATHPRVVREPKRKTLPLRERLREYWVMNRDEKLSRPNHRSEHRSTWTECQRRLNTSPLRTSCANSSGLIVIVSEAVGRGRALGLLETSTGMLLPVI
jgi:hypothetical protein